MLLGGSFAYAKPLLVRVLLPPRQGAVPLPPGGRLELAVFVHENERNDEVGKLKIYGKTKLIFFLSKPVCRSISRCRCTLSSLPPGGRGTILHRKMVEGEGESNRKFFAGKILLIPSSAKANAALSPASAKAVWQPFMSGLFAASLYYHSLSWITDPICAILS